MAEAKPRLDGAQTKTSTEPRVLHTAEPVAPSDADVHAGGVGVVDEQLDTKAKVGEALETATNGAAGDNPVERSDSVAVVSGQAIPRGVAEQAETAEDVWAKVCDLGFFEEVWSREDVQRDRVVLLEALSKIDLSDCDEDQWRL